MKFVVTHLLGLIDSRETNTSIKGCTTTGSFEEVEVSNKMFRSVFGGTDMKSAKDCCVSETSCAVVGETTSWSSRSDGCTFEKQIKLLVMTKVEACGGPVVITSDSDLSYYTRGNPEARSALWLRSLSAAMFRKMTSLSKSLCGVNQRVNNNIRCTSRDFPECS